MSTSIYYRAARKTPLTTAESNAVIAIARRYSRAAEGSDVDLKEVDLCLYSPPFDDATTVLEGATTLPEANEESMWTAVRHWCAALSALRRLLPSAEWSVSVDDHKVEWDARQQAYDPTQ